MKQQQETQASCLLELEQQEGNQPTVHPSWPLLYLTFTHGMSIFICSVCSADTVGGTIIAHLMQELSIFVHTVRNAE